jgi:3-deoxy-D-manno-octulosonate 8-phosphate phosphatase KdsC-like HAD superfamily phosphatase
VGNLKEFSFPITNLQKSAITASIACNRSGKWVDIRLAILQVNIIFDLVKPLEKLSYCKELL